MKTIVKALENIGDVEAALAFAANNLRGEVLEEGAAKFMIAGDKVTSLKPILDEFREFPERAIGSATLTSETSFVDHVKRHRAPSSVIFANDFRKAPVFVAVYDYHDQGTAGRVGGQPRHGGHRAKYAPAMSDEWVTWVDAAAAGYMEAGQFAEFVEDRILDIVTNPAESAVLSNLRDTLGGDWAAPTDLMTLSRGLQLNVSETVKSGTRLSSGEIQVQFEQKHTDGRGADLRVPTLFAIGIPVFREGPRYQIAVRLRYRVNGGKVTWAVAPHGLDAAWDHAFAEIVDRVATDSSTPVFRGSPEN